MTVMPNGVNLIPDNNGVSRTDAASAENGPQLELLYTEWKRDPASVDEQWHAFFSGFELGCQQLPRRAPAPAKTTPPASSGTALASVPEAERLRQSRVDALVSAYRRLGHQAAKIDPLNLLKRTVPELALDYVKLSDADLDTEFEIYWAGKLSFLPLHEIIELLKEPTAATWASSTCTSRITRFAAGFARASRKGRLRKDTLPNAEKKRVLSHLLEGELFEKFLHTRYVGQKRFSLEGWRDGHPHSRQDRGGMSRHGVEQIVMGMAHRGRLNVLANILGKDYEFVFNEFAENFVPNSELGDGDVKYHMGYDSIVSTSTGPKIGISLAPNPSHLETVCPVVEGKARAWQRQA